jgi:mono/diheme cytochrome c family protein
LALTLNPRPADLSVHTAPGVHTDAQLYGWITSGFPGSAMPAFAKILSDTQRWHLVNYIRTLAPK